MIKKLKDERCWMLENLALDPTDATTASNMNESNTNASAEAIDNLLHGGSTITDWGNTAIANVTTGFLGGYTEPRINNVNKDLLVTSYGPASTNGQAKVGIYYNFCAASAGTSCGSVNIANASVDVTQDICPANWRIPTGGYGGEDVSEYQVLIQAYNTDAISVNSLQYNLSLPLSGHFYDEPPALDLNSRGEWWSSTPTGASMKVMHQLTANKTSVTSYGDEDSDEGLSMRCLVSK